MVLLYYYFFVISLISFLQITLTKLILSNNSPLSPPLSSSSSSSNSSISSSSSSSYSSYYPAKIELFIKEHRCQYLSSSSSSYNKKSREIINIEKYDELFRDILEYYDEKQHLHHKQTFMGTRIGQFPFDLQVITEILYEVKPDLIIETGTNAGGFALYLASMMSVINPKCKILTVDQQSLKKWQKRFGGELPSEKQLWKDMVTYKEMKSDSKEFLSIAKSMSHSAKNVLVILDSFHEVKTVWDEIINLCLPFVTNSSYCIVEDTVLGTPMDAIRIFYNLTNESDEFCIDGDREYFGLSQHRGGYLRRISTNSKLKNKFHQNNKQLIDKINSEYNRLVKLSPFPPNTQGPRFKHDKELLYNIVKKLYNQTI